MKRFRSGVNFGCWISQYRRLDYDLFRSMIGKDDVMRVKDWGFDHIRLPFDYPVLLDDSDLYAFKPEGLAFLDDVLLWCKDAGLALLMDLHWAPGYRFGDKGRNRLFETSTLCDVFTALWAKLAERYRAEGDALAFDLLNEVAEPEYHAPWVDLAQKTVREIRKISPARDVIYGGANYNSVHMLGELSPMDDDYVTYNFHYYEPILFTHQFAPWNALNVDYGRRVDYPGEFDGLEAFLKRHSGYAQGLALYRDMRCDRATLERDLNNARDFQNRTGRAVYCGEYGVIDAAPREGMLRWMEDFTHILNGYRIGRAVWNYLGGSFGLKNPETGDAISPEQIRIITQTW